MSKKKSAIDSAIESLELDVRDMKRNHASELESLNAKYTGRIEGLEASIRLLRDRQRQTPKLKKLVAVEKVGA